MILQKLEKAKLIQPPKWMVGTGSIHYLTIMGSTAYGVSDGASDLDIYGFCIPPKEMTFPHLAGELAGFGTQIQRFEQWSQHHIPNPDGKDVTYDFAVYSIVKYVQLVMENNPNMIDSLFTPRRCVLHSTAIGEYIRENRKLFLHKGAWHKFKGYAYSNFHKYKAPHRETLKPVFDFQNTHTIQNLDIINSIRRELARRRLSHGIQDTKFDGYDVRKTKADQTT